MYSKRWVLVAIILILMLSVPSDPTAARTQAAQITQIGQGRTIWMARATWDTGWFQAEIFKLLFQSLGYTVEGPRTYDNDEFYQAVAQGEVDVWVNGWFPLHQTHITDSNIRESIDIVGYEVRGGALQGYLVDKATAGIGITSNRETALNFSHPYFESGLQILVAKEGRGLWGNSVITLLNDDVDAVVYDAPVLQHYAANEGAGEVETVGLVFQTLDYGVALPQNSPHREAINLALLQLIERGEYQQLYEEWFGDSS